ncbi:MAG: hypothetical protein J6U64_00575 [Alphaproteobacteria bacterium]|nr:hypothetical protein [Alphaproteobacteria bacterium]
MLDKNLIFKTDNAPQKAVLFLHGYGANGEDLLSMAPVMSKTLKNTLFYAPDAPYSIGYNSYKWFDIDGLESASVFERFDYLERLTKLAKQSLGIVDKILEEISLTYGIDYKNISIVGFSQGALITLIEGLTTKKKIASLGACSSVPLIISDALKIEEIINRPPVFVSHGTADDIVPFVGFEITVNTLKNLDISTTQHTVAGMGHGIDGTTLQALTQFLKQTLSQ